MLISLSPLSYFLNVSALANAEAELQPQAEPPEVTGNMPALEQFLASYRDMAAILDSYRGLLQKDVEELRNTGTAMISAESSLLK